MSSAGDSNDAFCDVTARPGYASCIKIDGRSILPPIMTEMKRAEMRHYRELAIGVENSMKYAKKRSQGRKSKIQMAVEQVPLNTTVSVDQTLVEDGQGDLKMQVDDEPLKLNPKRQYFDDDICTDYDQTTTLSGDTGEPKDEEKMECSDDAGVETTNTITSVATQAGDAATCKDATFSNAAAAMEAISVTPYDPYGDSQKAVKPTAPCPSSSSQSSNGNLLMQYLNQASKISGQPAATSTPKQVEKNIAVDTSEHPSVHHMTEFTSPQRSLGEQLLQALNAIAQAPDECASSEVIDGRANRAATTTQLAEEPKVNLNVTKVIHTIPEEKEEGISEVEETPKLDFDDHFIVKKPQDNKDWETFDGSSSVSEYSSAESELHSVSIMPNVGSAESYQEKNISYCPPLDEADQKSEAMSLVSLDTEEEKIRQAIIQEQDNSKNSAEEQIDTVEASADGVPTADQYSEDELSDISVENYVPVNSSSGRSSTETFIIERHDPTDLDNNNEAATLARKHYFSPVREGETRTIFALEDAPATVKAKRYFDSPSPNPMKMSDVEISHLAKLTEISVVTSCYPASNKESPKQMIPVDNMNVIISPGEIKAAPNVNTSGISKRLFYDSPEENENSVSLSCRSVQCQTGTDVSDISSTPLIIDSDHESVVSPRKKQAAQGNKYYPLTTSKVELSSSDIEITPRSPTKPSKIPLSPSKLNSMQQPKQNNKNSKRMSRAQMKAATEISQAKNGQIRVSKSKVSVVPAAPVPVQPKATESKVTEYAMHQPLAGVNLSSLQTTMQSMSPSFFKAPPDARSPLLKGVLFIDPLFRPQRELRIPPVALEPAMHPKFCKVSAAAKGYLIRRLLRTEKIQMIIQTIRDTVELVLKLYEESPQLRFRGSPDVKPEDAELCRRLFQQLTGACQSFHDVFFKLTTQQRMAIIASDREKMKSKELRAYLTRSVPPRVSHSIRNSVRGGKTKSSRTSMSAIGTSSKRKLSTATVKSIQRRMSSLHT